VLRDILPALANALRDEGALDEREAFIDAKFASAKGGGEEIGKTKRGKGVKTMTTVDRHGLPLAGSTYAVNHHEVTLVYLSFDFYMMEAKPDNLIGDRAYDSDKLDEELRRDGIEMIWPHRSGRRKLKTQEGRRLRCYERRWLVERFFAWLQWQLRLLVRWEFYAQNFLSVVQLASISILVKRF
jgi:transposase